MLFDQPLELVEQRGRMVFSHVVERLNISGSSAVSSSKQETSKEQKEPVVENVATPASTEKPISLKNKTRGAIVGYWLRGEKDLFRHLNGAILITLRALQAKRIEKDKAVEIVTNYAETLPNKEIRSRLMEDFPVVRDT